MNLQIESVGLSLNMKCGNCHGPVHVPGLVRNLVCPHCAHKVVVQWKGLERDLVMAAADKKVAYDFYGAQSSAHGRFEARRARACCPECKSELDLAQLDAEATSIPCSQGHAVSVRPAEKLAHTLIPGACWIVGEGIVVEAGTQAEHDLLLINCKACGGELEIQPSKRDVPCGYCSSLNVVSDELWMRLHPELQPREFFLLAAWSDDEFAAQAGAMREWHSSRPKKRRPLYKDETALCGAWPRPERSGLDWLVGTMGTQERVALSFEKGLPASLVLRLASDAKVPVRERMANSPSLTPEAQEILSRDPNANVLRNLADRKDLLPSVAEALIASGDDNVIGQIERNPQASLPIRLALARAGRPRLLEELDAAAVSAEELPLLVAHEANPEARLLAARHPDADPTLLAKLATDAAPEVRRVVAAREALPSDLVEALLQDPDKGVRKAIRARSDLPEALELELAAQDDHRLEAVLRREDCPEKAFELGVASKSKRVHRLMARHPRVPEIVLVALAETSTDNGILNALIDHERTPLLRAAMAAAGAERLREAVCADPLTPPQLVLLAGDTKPEVRRRIAERPDLPAAVALLLADDPVPQVQEAVAGHAAVRARTLRRRLMWAAVTVFVLGGLGCAGLFAALSAGLVSTLSG